MTKREWWEVINDIWKFIKKHHAPRTEAEWEQAIKEAEQLSGKYETKAGARNVIMDILEAWNEGGKE